MSILKVNDIRRATTGSATLVFNDPVTITSGTISASVLIGNLPGGVTIGDATIGKEKLTNDARDFVNILNKPSGLLLLNYPRQYLVHLLVRQELPPRE